MPITNLENTDVNENSLDKMNIWRIKIDLVIHISGNNFYLWQAYIFALLVCLSSKEDKKGRWDL